MGAWWLGYLIAGVITLLAAIPFWFLPRSLPLSGPRRPPEDSPLQKHKYPAESKTTFVEMAKGEEEDLEEEESILLYVIILFVCRPRLRLSNCLISNSKKKIK